jgi:hypothetical protein
MLNIGLMTFYMFRQRKDECFNQYKFSININSHSKKILILKSLMILWFRKAQ